LLRTAGVCAHPGTGKIRALFEPVWLGDATGRGAGIGRQTLGDGNVYHWFDMPSGETIVGSWDLRRNRRAYLDGVNSCGVSVFETGDPPAAMSAARWTRWAPRSLSSIGCRERRPIFAHSSLEAEQGMTHPFYMVVGRRKPS
jgi:hypothetical protein